MASRVNVKFVLILSAALTLVFAGVAGIALWVLSNSGPELERSGDQMMAAGEYESAKKLYGKAYNHDRSSIARLDKYIEAIEAWTPDSPTEYGDAYASDLLSAFHTRAGILKTDIASHRRYLEARYQQARWYNSRNVWESLADATDDAVGYFEFDSSGSNEWHVLQRYRGVALVELMDRESDTSAEETISDAQTAQAEQDLQAALLVDPDDSMVAVALSRYYQTKSRKLSTSRRTQSEAAEAATKARDSIDLFLATHPTDAEAIAYRIVLTYVQADAALDDSLRGLDLRAARETITSDLVTPLDRLFDAYASKPTEEIDPLRMDRVLTLEQMVNNDSVRSAALIDRVLKDRPNDAPMRNVRAYLARQKKDFDLALSHYNAVKEMESPPVSLEGMILLFAKEQTAVSMLETALAIWEDSTAEDKASAMELVKELRVDASELLRESDARLILLDGKIAFAEQDFTTAQEKLGIFNDLSGGINPVVHAMLAEIYIKSNEMGSARKSVEAMALLQPHLARPFILLAQIEFALSNFEVAREYAEHALEIEPDNTVVADILMQLQGTINPDDIAASNPVQAALLRSRSLAMGDGVNPPNFPDAISTLDNAFALLSESSPEFGSDREKIIIQQIELLSISGKRADALVKTREWLQTYPDNEHLASLQMQLSAPDSLEGDLQLIDAGTGPAHLKLVSKYLAAMRREDDDLAAQFLREALIVAPTDATVVDFAFSDALRRSEFDEADKLRETAVAANLDRMNGDGYKARLQAAEGDVAKAITTLRQATQSPTAPASALRMLGQFQSQMGLYSDAIESFTGALSQSPNDVNTVVAYLNTLVRSGRNLEALRIARRHEQLANSSSQFIRIWLHLEAQFGDKSIAVARREEIQRRVPDNRENITALAAMYIDLDRLDEAKVLVEKMREQNADLVVVNLDAKLNEKAGNLPAAREIFETYIGSRVSSAEGVKYSDYATYASFLINAKLVDEAISVLRQARTVQSPQALEADANLGRILLDLDRVDEAIESLRIAVKSGDNNIRVLLAQALINAQKIDEAKVVIEASDDEWAHNLELTLVMIDCLSIDGDIGGALRLADEAAREFDDSPLPYIARARLKAQDEATLGDALDDLTSAIRRDSTHWVALSLRAEINRQLGNPDDALQDLRSAVKANPTLDFERRVLMLELFRTGRYRDAKMIADDAIAARPGEVDVVISMGDLFASAGSWDQAVGYFADAWASTPSQLTGMRYVASLIRTSDPSQRDLNDADRVLADPICDTENTAGMLVIRASLRMAQKKPNIARRDASRAVQLAAPDLATAARILENLNTVFETPQETAEFILGQDLSAMPGRAGDHFRAIAMMQIADRADEGFELLRQVSADESDPIIRTNARQQLIAILLSPERDEYAEALTLMKAALLEEPESWTYANNIAYVLAMEMDQLSEALAYSEKALKIAPKNASVLDTIGYVYRRLNRYDEAERSLELAIEYAPNPGMRVTALIHLGQTHVEQGDGDGAQKALEEIETIYAALGADATNNPEVQDLKQQIEGLK